MLDEPIGAGAAVRQLFGVTHADQVRSDAAAERLQVRDDVAPEIRRGGVAVQQHDRIPVPNFEVGHLAAEDLPPLFFVGKCRRNHIPTS
jgi:hypothetical protein